jgi:hypothetical protein
MAALSAPAALAHRWPTALGALAALGMILGDPDRTAVALVVAIATTCYVAAAVFARPWMAWAWIPLAFVVVVAGKLVDLEPMVTTGAAAAALVVVGLARSTTRPAVTLETAGLLGYGAFAAGALLLAPAVGLVVVALTLIAHGIWDVWHLRRHATWSPRRWPRRASPSTCRSGWPSSSSRSPERGRPPADRGAGGVSRGSRAMGFVIQMAHGEAEGSSRTG